MLYQIYDAQRTLMEPFADSVPLMVCSNIRCSQHSPSRIKPH